MTIRTGLGGAISFEVSRYTSSETTGALSGGDVGGATSAALARFFSRAAPQSVSKALGVAGRAGIGGAVEGGIGALASVGMEIGLRSLNDCGCGK